MRLYGAYGSNLNTEQMRKRCPNSIPLCSIYLEDWSLVFKGVADLEKNRGSIALLGIYEITKECEKSLDLYEEYPIVYNKVNIKKKVEGRIRNIMLYTMNEKYQYAKPTVKYFKVIENGYKDWNSSLKSLYSSCLHSIENNTSYGYKSENWRDKKYINESFLRKRIN